MRRNETNDPEELLEAWGQPRRRPRGRPSADKGRLMADRDELVGLLSAMWADIGWDLLHVKTSGDIRRTLAPLKNDTRRSKIEHFLRDSSSKATAAEVRKSAALVSVTCVRRFDTQKRRDALRKDFDEIQLAQTQATAEQLTIIEPIFRQRRSEFEAAETSVKDAENDEKHAESILADQEAGFAQREILKFIRSGKYAHNPLSLANAMAGMRCYSHDGMRVYAGCWQSYSRCSKLECTGCPTYQFQRFEIIRSIWNRRHKYPNLSAVELFRQEIPKLPKTTDSRAARFVSQITTTQRRRVINGFVRGNFMDEFRHLRLAVEESQGGQSHPARMPYLILAHFTRRLGQPSTAVDRVLVASERLRDTTK